MNQGYFKTDQMNIYINNKNSLFVVTKYTIDCYHKHELSKKIINIMSTKL